MMCLLFLLTAITLVRGSAVLSPQGNITVFENSGPVVLNCNGNGDTAKWKINGTDVNGNNGIRFGPIDPVKGALVPSYLSAPSNVSNNNIVVLCKVIDTTADIVYTSDPTNLYVQGLLDAPYNFFVTNGSNSTFILSWGAPYSLNVTNYSQPIFSYTLCASLYGCETIPSHQNCTFPKTCTSSVDFSDTSLNDTIGGEHKSIMDDVIQFTMFAINGAGNGSKAYYTFSNEIVMRTSQTVVQSSTSTTPTASLSTSPFRSSVQSNLLPIVLPVTIIAGVVTIAVVVLFAVLFIKAHPKKGKLAISPHHNVDTKAGELVSSSLSQSQEKKSAYVDVVLSPIISIPEDPHQVQYSEVVKPPHNEPKTAYADVALSPVISIPECPHQVQYSEVVKPPCNEPVTCRSSHSNSDSGFESEQKYSTPSDGSDIHDEKWCQGTNQAHDSKFSCLHTGIDPVKDYCNKGKDAITRMLLEQCEDYCHSSFPDHIKKMPNEATHQKEYNSDDNSKRDNSNIRKYTTTLQLSMISPTVCVYETDPCESSQDLHSISTSKLQVSFITGGLSSVPHFDEKESEMMMIDILTDMLQSFLSIGGDTCIAATNEDNTGIKSAMRQQHYTCIFRPYMDISIQNRYYIISMKQAHQKIRRALVAKVFQVKPLFMIKSNHCGPLHMLKTILSDSTPQITEGCKSLANFLKIAAESVSHMISNNMGKCPHNGVGSIVKI